MIQLTGALYIGFGIFQGGFLKAAPAAYTYRVFQQARHEIEINFILSNGLSKKLSTLLYSANFETQ
jgi:hypothetical protein